MRDKSAPGLPGCHDGLMTVAEEYLRAARALIPLFGSAELSARWDEPSVLAEFTVRGLAGHLARTVTVPRFVLAEPEPPEQPTAIDAAVRYADAAATFGARAGEIRANGEKFSSAAGGPAGLQRAYSDALDDLAARLARQPGDRRVRSKGGVYLLDDYLVGRAVELYVHADDLALSLQVPTPVPSPVLFDQVVARLVGAARARHGDLAVLRALTRRERDTVEAMRVI